MPLIGARRSLLNAGAKLLWTPDKLGSALAAWWDPNQGITLGTGSNVASWADRAGGLVASQATAAQQPTFSATARNGKPGLVFNGSKLGLSFNPASLPQGASPSHIAVSATSTSASQNFFIYGTVADSKMRQFSTDGSGKAKASLYYGDVVASTAMNGDRFLEFTYASGTVSLFQDAVSQGTAANTAQTTGTLGQIGSQGSGAQFNGTLQHILVCSRVLTAAEQQKLQGWESWANGKAGANLPAAHPYRNRPPSVTDP